MNLPVGIVATLTRVSAAPRYCAQPEGRTLRSPRAGAFQCWAGRATAGDYQRHRLRLVHSADSGTLRACGGLAGSLRRTGAALCLPYARSDLFENRRYGFSVAAAALQSLAMFAVSFLLVFYLQGVRAYSPLTAALLILPMPLVGSILGPFSGRWADHIGGAIPATLGLVTQPGALGAVLLTPTTPYPVLGLALTLMGVGSGFFWSANTSMTMGAAPPTRLGVASATLNTLRNIGMIFSFALALAVTAAAMPPVWNSCLPGHGRSSLRHHFSRLHQRHGARLPVPRRNLWPGYLLLVGAPGTPGAAGHSAPEPA